MPKTLINEFDNTTGAASSSLTNTVYIPCSILQEVSIVEESGADPVTYQFTKLAGKAKEKDLLPHLLTSVAELEAFAEENIKAVYTSTAPLESGQEEPLTIEIPVSPQNGASFILARYLLNNGCYVLFQIVTEDTKKAWSNRFIELQDRGLYDFKFITLGEFVEGFLKADEESGDFSGKYDIEDVVACAEKRGDCIALIDHPQTIPAEVLESGDDEDDYSLCVHRWIEKNIHSSYVGAFSPWCSNTMYNTGTKANPKYPLLPASFSFLVTYANSIKTNPNWLAAAGAFRGIVPGLVKVGHKYGERDIDNLQCRVTTFSGSTESFGDGDNIGVACNPICNVDPFGVIIWGNRTGLVNEAGGLKATSFLNIRNLACDIKKTMWKAARRYTFEQNTLRLWLNFCSQITPLLDRAKTGEGISAYELIREETNAKGRLKARVVIVPIEAVEDFELSFVLEDTIETEESAG